MTTAREEDDVTAVLRRIRDAFFGELRDPRERLRRRAGIQLWAEAQRDPEILKIMRRGLNGPRKLLKAIVSDAQRRKEISNKIDPDSTARFLIAAFHGFVLQLEWDSQINPQPYMKLLDSFLKSLSLSV